MLDIEVIEEMVYVSGVEDFQLTQIPIWYAYSCFVCIGRRATKSVLLIHIHKVMNISCI